ncbi:MULTISPECIES: peptidase domain-containing ABC transporter [Clostridia]|uniref:peptidase domain-containing ABC transporter n=1 Tax=Clostridia TaxID=186801 RepID=UPI000EA02AE5|nr:MULTISPECIES: peptidase domain-containing ABC transporter [Clostridia]NBJ69533.1 peptidase domain-containing ABC transporter [Roseburia sp. 1XD42-34]RKI78605.1 peptidase domain-containing ABC transporter [Clostridium sp. 1xD42-85]
MYNFKIPIILQNHQYECGLACLSMLFSWKDSKVNTNMFDHSYNIGRDGISAQQLKKITEKHKASFYAFQVSDIKDFIIKGKIKQPLMLYWKNNHYVILKKIKNDIFYIIDPGTGEKSFSEKEFYKNFSNVVFFINKKDRNKNIFLKKTSYLKDLLKIVTPYKKNIFTIIFLSVLFQILNLILPVLTQYVVDYNGALNNSLLSNTLLILIIIVGLSVFLLHIARTFFVVNLQIRINNYLTDGTIKKIFKLPFSFFEKNTSGDLSTRINNITVIREILSNVMTSLLLDVALIFIFSITMLYYSPILTGIVFIAVIIQLLVTKLVIPRITLYTNQEVANQTLFQTNFLSVLQSIDYIKTLGNNKLIYNRTINPFHEQLVNYKKKMLSSAVLGGTSYTISVALPLLIIYLGVFQVGFVGLSIGETIAFSTIAVRFLTPFSSIFNSIQSFKYVEEIFNRINKILLEDDESELLNRSKKISDLKGGIELQNVSFGYGEENVLENINLQINYGDKILINGRSGKGKTTLLKIIASLHFPTTGEILINGNNLNEYDISSYRENIGMVTQDVSLLSGTVKENISFFNEALDEEVIINSSKIACIYDDVMNFAMGFDTLLGENGTNLSGGQKQRLSIARAISSNSDLLLIDEGTSNLDEVTEQTIIDNLFQLDKTIIFITHRHSYIPGVNKKVDFTEKSIKVTDFD